MSLPLCLGADARPAKFPYLTPDQSKVDAWAERLSGDKHFKIGLAWTSRADHPRNDLRSFPVFDLLSRLKDIQGVTFYSLQQNQPEQARKAELIDFTRELESFDDTAALVCNLDLVIAMDAVIAHLAGAMDIPAWVLVDVNPFYGWGRHGRETVWYRSVRVYRQQKMHNWTSVFEEIRRDLKCEPTSYTKRFQQLRTNAVTEEN